MAAFEQNPLKNLAVILTTVCLRVKIERRTRQRVEDHAQPPPSILLYRQGQSINGLSVDMKISIPIQSPASFAQPYA